MSRCKFEIKNRNNGFKFIFTARHYVINLPAINNPDSDKLL